MHVKWHLTVYGTGFSLPRRTLLNIFYHISAGPPLNVNPPPHSGRPRNAASCRESLDILYQPPPTHWPHCPQAAVQVSFYRRAAIAKTKEPQIAFVATAWPGVFWFLGVFLNTVRRAVIVF